MAQSLVKNYLHIIFSTKHREPLILPFVEIEHYAYLGGICNGFECSPIKIGGYIDHVHVLCLLSKKIALVKFIEELKSSSSKWIKSKDDLLLISTGKMVTERSLSIQHKLRLLNNISKDNMSIIERKHFRKNIVGF